MKKKTDLYQRVTDQIVTALEAGTRPWSQPWADGAQCMKPPLRFNGTPYRGINVLLLWSEAMKRKFSSRTWLTYQQAHELGAQVRKGESGTRIIFSSSFTKTDRSENGEDESTKTISYLKEYVVFNLDQIDQLPAKYIEPAERNTTCDVFFNNIGIDVINGGNRACYMRALDRIKMPNPESFRDMESYYAVLAHEYVHATGHAKRLDRTFGKRFGDATYAVEELVAEIGSAFLCAQLGLSLEPREDHVDYIASWLKVLKQDKRAVFTAASAAQRATDWLIKEAAPVAVSIAA